MLAEDLAKFLNSYSGIEDSPWVKWWDKNYCLNCESITTFVPYLDSESECAYCELNKNCRFFPDKEDAPSLEEIIQMWLESEAGE